MTPAEQQALIRGAISVANGLVSLGEALHRAAMEVAMADTAVGGLRVAVEGVPGGGDIRPAPSPYPQPVETACRCGSPLGKAPEYLHERGMTGCVYERPKPGPPRERS